MSLYLLSIVGAALLFLLIVATGFLLHAKGSPYGVGVLAVHKLASLALAVLLGYVTFQANRGALLGVAELALLAGTGVLLLELFVTGGLLSSGASRSPAVTMVHRTSPWLAAVTAGAALYLLVP